MKGVGKLFVIVIRQLPELWRSCGPNVNLLARHVFLAPRQLFYFLYFFFYFFIEISPPVNFFKSFKNVLLISASYHLLHGRKGFSCLCVSKISHELLGRFKQNVKEEIFGWTPPHSRFFFFLSNLFSQDEIHWLISVTILIGLFYNMQLQQHGLKNSNSSIKVFTTKRVSWPPQP